MDVARACKSCDAPLAKKPGRGRWPHYCSPDCKARATRTPLTLTACEQCATEFATNRGRRFCSDRCRNRHLRENSPEYVERSRERNRERYAPRSSVAFITCDHCGELTTARMSTARYCRRAACRLDRLAARMAAKRAADSTYGRTGYNEATAERYHRRRALKKGATVEAFSHVEVFERDNWTCGICGESVDPELKWPDPLSVSLDHVVPLALGGDHSRANTQCSHLTCNVRKGAQVA